MEIKRTNIEKQSTRLVEVESEASFQPSLPTVANKEQPPPATPVRPAKNSSLFVRRFFAWMTDSVIISLLALVVEMIVVMAMSLACNCSLPTFSEFLSYDAVSTYVLIWLFLALYNFAPLPFLFLTVVSLQRSHSSFEALLYSTLMLLAASITQIFYYVRFNSSSLGVSPGKFIFGLKTEDSAGKPLTTKQVIYRELLKQVSTSFLCIPSLLSLLYPPADKQLLHDAIAKTRVHDNSKTGEKKTSHKLAPFVAITSSLLTGFTLYQLAAPQLYELSLAPKLQAYKLIFGENSAVYKDLIWNDIGILTDRFSDPNIGYYGKLSKTQIERLKAETNWLEGHENKTDKRFREAYRGAISYFDKTTDQEAISFYFKRFIELGERTHDPSLLAPNFHCSDGMDRNAYAAFADSLLSEGERQKKAPKAKDYFKQALLITERGIKMAKDKSSEEQIDAVIMRYRAAKYLGDSLIQRDSLKTLTDLERRLFLKEFAKGTNPRDIYGVGSVYEMFNNLMELASLQEGAGDATGLKVTAFYLQDIFNRAGHLDGWTKDRWQRISLDEKSQLKRLAVLFPEYAKTLLEMAGEK